MPVDVSYAEMMSNPNQAAPRSLSTELWDPVTSNNNRLDITLFHDAILLAFQKACSGCFGRCVSLVASLPHDVRLEIYERGELVLWRHLPGEPPVVAIVRDLDDSRTSQVRSVGPAGRGGIFIDAGPHLGAGRIPARKPELVLHERPTQRRTEIPETDDLVASFNPRAFSSGVKLFD